MEYFDHTTRHLRGTVGTYDLYRVACNLMNGFSPVCLD
jgi:hypothetical protein